MSNYTIIFFYFVDKNKKNRVKPKRPCPFCGKEASRLTDHIRRKHKTEESVRAAMSLPKELRDRELGGYIQGEHCNFKRGRTRS